MTAWVASTIGDICTFNYGKALRTEERTGTRFAVYGSNGPVGSNEKAITSGATIIVGRKGSLGEVHYSDQPCWPIDTTYFIDNDSAKVDLRWLFYLLKSKDLSSMNRSAAVPGLNREDAYRLPVLVPPLPEQRRIAAVLDKADELLTKRNKSHAVLDSLISSSFSVTFGTGLTSPVTERTNTPSHPKGWEWELLTDVARLATGHTPDRERPDYWNGGIPWISLTEIRGLDGRVAQSTDLNVSPEGIRHSSSVVLPPGTVCFSRTASIGFVTVMGREMATSQDFVNWVCGARLDPIYLMHALLAARTQLRALSAGSTHKTIYMRVAERFRVLVPPIEVQGEFRQRVERATAVRSHQQRSGQDLDAMFASLQNRAFSGGL